MICSQQLDLNSYDSWNFLFESKTWKKNSNKRGHWMTLQSSWDDIDTSYELSFESSVTGEQCCVPYKG